MSSNSIDFWTNNNFQEFWSYVRMLLVTISPGIMLVIGTAAAGLLLYIVVKLYYDSRNDDDNSDDDYEIRRY